MITAGAAAWGRSTIELAPLPHPVPEADLYVIGLGGAGLSAVAEARRRDLHVVGIDASGVAAGATGRNGGFLLAGRADFFHRTVDAIGLEAAGAVYRLTVAEIRRMATETPDAVRTVGSWRVAADPAEEDDLIDHYTALRLAGIAATREATPWGAGVLLPDDAAFDPVARSTAVATALMAEGAALYIGRIDDIGALGGPVVVAVDGGLETVVPEMAGRVRTARLQMLATEPTDEVSVPRPVYRRWGFDYWQQHNGRVLVGGLRDSFEHDEWSSVAEPTEAVQQALELLLRDVVGVRRAAISHRWAGCSAFTSDTRPRCELVRDGVAVVGGYSGTGNVVGPLCGRAAVQLLFDGASAVRDTLLA